MWAVICPVICPGVATTVLVIDIPGCMKGGLDTGDIIAGGNMAWFAEENIFFFYSGPMGPLIVYLFFYNILLYLYCTTISHKIYDIHKIINTQLILAIR